MILYGPMVSVKIRGLNNCNKIRQITVQGLKREEVRCHDSGQPVYVENLKTL